MQVGSHKFAHKLLLKTTSTTAKPAAAAGGLLLKATKASIPSNSGNKNICDFELAVTSQNSSPQCLTESSFIFKPPTSFDIATPRAASAPPNLELTLASPTPLDQTKVCTRRLLIGAITVV